MEKIIKFISTVIWVIICIIFWPPIWLGAIIICAIILTHIAVTDSKLTAEKAKLVLMFAYTFFSDGINRIWKNSENIETINTILENIINDVDETHTVDKKYLFWIIIAWTFLFWMLFIISIYVI